jgi:hypothetical protein
MMADIALQDEFLQKREKDEGIKTKPKKGKGDQVHGKSLICDAKR